MTQTCMQHHYTHLSTQQKGRVFAFLCGVRVAAPEKVAGKSSSWLM